MFDSSYVHENTGSHHHIEMAAGVPASWISPVRFTNGRTVFRLQVKQKPNQTTPTTYTLCMSQGAGSSCEFIGRFDQTGVFSYEAKLPFSYVKNGFDWSRATAPTDLRVVVKDTKNNNIDEGSSFDGAPDRSLYLPLDVRLTAWVVTNGATVDMSDSPLEPTPPVDMSDLPPEPTPPVVESDAGILDAGPPDSGDPSSDAGAGTDSSFDETPSPKPASTHADSGDTVTAATAGGIAPQSDTSGVTGGCSAAGHRSSTPMLSFALLGLALLARRTRTLPAPS